MSQGSDVAACEVPAEPNSAAAHSATTPTTGSRTARSLRNGDFEFPRLRLTDKAGPFLLSRSAVPAARGVGTDGHEWDRNRRRPPRAL